MGDNEGVPVTPLTPQRRRQLTRDTLVDAAAEAFARRGIHASSLEQIAAAAGFSKGAIYANFGSKEELLLAVVEQRGEQMLAAMWEAHQASDHDHLQDPAGAAEVWRRIVAADEQMQMLRLELRLYAMREPSFQTRLAELQRQQRARATEFLQREAEGAGFTFRLPPDRVAGLLIALTEGLLQQAGVDPDSRPVYEQDFELFLTLLITAGTEAGDSTRRSRRGRTASRSASA